MHLVVLCLLRCSTYLIFSHVYHWVIKFYRIGVILSKIRNRLDKSDLQTILLDSRFVENSLVRTQSTCLRPSTSQSKTILNCTDYYNGEKACITQAVVYSFRDNVGLDKLLGLQLAELET